jgi:hypothetical protein
MKAAGDWTTAKMGPYRDTTGELGKILDQINKKAGYKSPADGQCPRPTDDSQFVGFVGHDTNLANMNVLLSVGWDFADPKLPPSLRQLPPNDALPAGALVFELRKGPQGAWE